MSDLDGVADGLPNHHHQMRRSRLLFRCWHRGTQESDLILGRFAEALEPVRQGVHRCFGFIAAGVAGAGAAPFHRCINPSVSACMKLTSAFSSSSESPSRPMNFVFMLSVDSGAGQHVVPSPGSLGPQRANTSRVL